MNERELCYKILYDIHFNGILSHIAIKKALDECDLRGETISKAFVTRLVNGEVEKHLTLMFLITHQAGRPEGKIKPALRIIMAEALYQAIYMKVPTSAAVNEAVKLAKKHKFQTLCGFVNGVLRRSLSAYEEFISTNPNATIKEYVGNILDTEYMDRRKEYKLSILHSCPEWLIAHFLEFMTDDELERMLEIDNSVSFTSVYMLECKTDETDFINQLEAEKIEYKKNSLTKNSYSLKLSGDIKNYDFFKKGLAIVQNVSSTREGDFIPVIPNARVLDICAAPGGKAIHCADKLSGHNGQVLACDLSLKKVKLINDTIKRCGLTNITTMVNDATEFNKEFKEAFDIVIADLPCSGLGVLMKKSDIKYKTTSDDIEELAQIQRDILNHIEKYVKKGGYVVYSTCTLTRSENEGNARYLADKGFKLLKEETLLPDIDQDGFYIALLQRN